MRSVRLLAVVAILFPFVPLPSAGAAVTTGLAHASCEADFPHVPALVWTDGGTCDGTATVAGVGVDDDGNDYRVAGAGTFTSSYRYHEPCLVDGQPAIFLSFAVGTFSISGIPAWHPATGTSAAQGTATITGDFAWYRAGANPVITVENVVVTLSGGLSGQATGPGLRGGGTATFVPPGTFDESAHLLCGQPGGPLTIPVEIAAALAF